MKSRKKEVRSQESGVRSKKSGIISCLFFLLVTFHCLLFTAVFAADWSGVDESVVEKYAKEHGREAHEPLINTDQGDLLLFVFLLAGTAGGFAAGYYWRQLTESRAKNGKPDVKAMNEFSLKGNKKD